MAKQAESKPERSQPDTEDFKKPNPDLVATPKGEQEASSAKADDKGVSFPSDTKFFRNKASAGERVMLPDGTFVRFSPFLEMYAGDPVKVGYLATDNKDAKKRLKDRHVEEIDQDEFVKRTMTGQDVKPLRAL